MNPPANKKDKKLSRELRGDAYDQGYMPFLFRRLRGGTELRGRQRNR